MLLDNPIKSNSQVTTEQTNNRGKLYDYTQHPESDVIIKEINRRYRKGLGTNIFVIGLSGTGKSSTSQRIGELLIESRKNKNKMVITDSLLGFVKGVRDSQQGDVIVVEEVSVLFPSRRAMSQDNVQVGSIFDTVRKKRLCIISNAPIWDSIDSHMRALGHILIETLVVKKTLGVVISKFHRLQTNPESGKTYRHTFNRDGRDVKIMYTKMPDRDKWAEYEKQKDEFMDNLYSRLEKKQREKAEKESGKPNVAVNVKQQRDESIYTMYKDYKIKISDIAKQMDLSVQRVWQILSKFKEK